MTDLTWLDADEQRQFRAFARATRRLFVQFDRDLRLAVNMPRTYFEILWLLYHAPDRALRMSDLAEATGSQPSRITHAVGRLEAVGHVRRELCPDDRRGWLAVLSDAGATALREAAPHYAKSVREHLLDPLLSRTQRDQLTRIGEELLAALDDATLPDVVPSSATVRPRATASKS